MSTTSVTDDNRKERVTWCKQMVKHFKDGKFTYVNSITAGDRTRAVLRYIALMGC